MQDVSVLLANLTRITVAERRIFRHASARLCIVLSIKKSRVCGRNRGDVMARSFREIAYDLYDLHFAEKEDILWELGASQEAFAELYSEKSKYKKELEEASLINYDGSNLYGIIMHHITEFVIPKLADVKNEDRKGYKFTATARELLSQLCFMYCEHESEFISADK